MLVNLIIEDETSAYGWVVPDGPKVWTLNRFARAFHIPLDAVIWEVEPHLSLDESKRRGIEYLKKMEGSED